MPRRSTRALASPSATPSPAFVVPEPNFEPYVLELRRQWKWAAFSQFFFTFNVLFAMDDVTLTDIEDDLTRSTNLVLSRIMQRLLYTLTQDRKISSDNWQNALRKQHIKRDPDANPIGPIVVEPASAFRESTRASTEPPPVEATSSMEPGANGPEAATADDMEKAVASPKEEQGEQILLVEDQISAEPDVTHVQLDDTRPKEEDMEPPAEPPAEQSADLPQEESKDWLSLPMLAKLESMHMVMEWQFQNPLRLRSLMKTDDETATWRIEPVGYDTKKNAYWLIGADRLWIQRERPRKNLKRKRAQPAKAQSTSRAARGTEAKQSNGRRQPNKRQRVDADSDVEMPPKPTKKTGGRNTRLSTHQAEPTTPSGRGGRVAKLRANEKLDAQAKELAEFQRQMSRQSNSTRGGRRQAAQSPSPRKPTGVRLSARLRGAALDEEWQEIPEEWLANTGTPESPPKDPSASSPSKGKEERMKTGLESDVESISELTELSSDSEDQQEGSNGGSPGNTLPAKMSSHKKQVKLKEFTPVQEESDPPDYPEEKVEDEDDGVPSNFIEWETICVTLQEWEHVADPFQKATHYLEKALYKTLAVNIAPIIIAELREIERKRRAEEAIVHRKRSSRIALKESEKEEARITAKRQAEEEEKLSRARRLEARLQKEEEERQRRESAREQRRLEREMRENRQDTEPGPDESAKEVRTDVPKNVNVDGRTVTLTTPYTNGASTSGSRTPIGEDWELNCEICRRRGINQDDGLPMMSCGICSKWQHIPCHDKADMAAGRPKRNWDTEEFICMRCRSIRNRSISKDSRKAALQPPSEKLAHSLPPVGHQSHFANQSHGFPNALHYGNTGTGGHYEQQTDLRAPVGPPHTLQAPQQSRNTTTFAHYQPHRGGFAVLRPGSDHTQMQQIRGQPVPSHTTAYSNHMAQPTSFQPLPYSQSSPYQSQNGWNNPPNPVNHSYHANGRVPVNFQYTTQIDPYYAGRTPVAPQMPYHPRSDTEQSTNQYSNYQYNR